jgi:hypothetical protein
MSNPRRDYRFSLHREYLHKFVDPTSSHGLEIGAFDTPFVELTEGRCDYADFRTYEELKLLAKHFPNIQEKYIVKPDFDLRDGYDAIESEYDWIVASHVIEHVPDLIGWIKVVSSKLKPSGLLFLVIPDRTYTFDAHRRETTFSDALSLHIQGITKPTYRQVFDHFYYTCDVPPAPDIWHNAHVLPPPTRNFETACVAAQRSLTEYVDVHCSVFTPDSFSKLAFEMYECNMIDLQLHAMRPTQYGQMDFGAMMRKIA